MFIHKEINTQRKLLVSEICICKIAERMIIKKHGKSNFNPNEIKINSAKKYWWNMCKINLKKITVNNSTATNARLRLLRNLVKFPFRIKFPLS